MQTHEFWIGPQTTETSLYSSFLTYILVKHTEATIHLSDHPHVLFDLNMTVSSL